MSDIAIPFAPLPRTGAIATPAEPLPVIPDTERKGLTKKEVAADHPTWCPGCGDFSVLALYFKLIEKRKMVHEKITTVAGIGCSSRFPYFVQAHGVHFIHGRALPFASGISLSRPDLHVFVFGGDGDAFSIGGNFFLGQTFAFCIRESRNGRISRISACSGKRRERNGDFTHESKFFARLQVKSV